MTTFEKNGFIQDILIITKIFDFSRQFKYLQLWKPLGVEMDKSIHKILAMDLLKGPEKGTPGSDRVDEVKKIWNGLFHMFFLANAIFQ